MDLIIDMDIKTLVIAGVIYGITYAITYVLLIFSIIIYLYMSRSANVKRERLNTM